MAETQKAIFFDGLNNHVNERDMSEDELENLKIVLREFQTVQENSKAKEDARESALNKLAALGLTEEEIAAL
jgi:hypothetical protein